MDKIFAFIEKKTAHIVFFFLFFVLSATISVPIWLHFQSGDWNLSYETNGQIGDFIGGILNPLIAFLALIWIAKGVKMQKQELEETKRALTDSAQAQKTQAIASAALVQLNALTALVTALNNEESNINREIAELLQNDKKIGFIGVNNEKISTLESKRAIASKSRKEYSEKIVKYLKEETN